jgi:hypothetical protein
MILLMKLAAFGSILLALMSAYPGVLNDVASVAILFCPIWIPAVSFVGWMVLLKNARAAQKPVKPELLADGEIGGGKSSVSHRRWFVVSIAILIVNFVLILSGIPTKVAFVLSRPAFQRHTATAPVAEYDGEAVGRLFGVYYVDLYAADPRGGVYFRTHAGADGIGPDTMSYGFVYRPNPKGTPFGNSGCRYSHVVGDWYCFSASND